MGLRLRKRGVLGPSFLYIISLVHLSKGDIVLWLSSLMIVIEIFYFGA